MKPAVYIETTVPSLLVAPPCRDALRTARQQVTAGWWENELGGFEPLVSAFVLEEMARGEPQTAAARLAAIAGFRILEATGAVMELGNRIAGELQLPAGARADAFHLSAAAVHGADCLVTWDFTHINNRHLRPRIVKICRAAGYTLPLTGSPEDLLLSRLPHVAAN